jgi:hypothetical protein
MGTGTMTLSSILSHGFEAVRIHDELVLLYHRIGEIEDCKKGCRFTFELFRNTADFF